MILKRLQSVVAKVVVHLLYVEARTAWILASGLAEQLVVALYVATSSAGGLVQVPCNDRRILLLDLIVKIANDNRRTRVSICTPNPCK